MPERFKIDENLPVEVAQLLRNDGIDATTVHEQNLSGFSDDHILTLCASENRVLVTLDLDFADIRHYPPQSYAGLVILRLRRQDKPYILNIFRRLMKAFPGETISGRLWIVNEKQIKVRG